MQNPSNQQSIADKQSQQSNRRRNIMDIQPIYSPRTSYKQIKTNDDKMIADMTLNFDKVTIQLLKQQFLAKNNELNLQQFIIIAKKHLKFWQVDTPNRQISLVRYLTFLFNEIDINGNGDMEWQQFTNYVIEKATVLKNLKSKADQVKHYVKSDISIKAKVQTTIQKLQYLPEIDKVAYFQQGSNKINFFTLSTGQPFSKPLVLDSKNLVVNISSVKKQKNGKVSIRKKDLVLPTNVRVLDMIFIPDKKYKVLIVSTSDGFVRGWKYHQGAFIRATQPDNQEELFEHSFNSQIYCLAWDGINEILYCGQKSGNIYMWNLKTDLERPLCQTPSQSLHPHKQHSLNPNSSSNNGQSSSNDEKINYMITCMITMPKLQFMASGRMDGKLVLWDTINNKKKWIYKEHSRGILTLAFNETMILLFSGGFDHKICIWNPYISTLIHKIQGHLSSILSLKVIQNSHQLISMDSEGIVKITDTKRFHIIYSFSVDTTNDMGEQVGSKKAASGTSAVSSLIAINNPLKLIFAGRALSVYQYDKNYNPDSADQNTVICCRYVQNLLCFFTPAGNKIKVWSALNGDVQKIYMDVTPNQISTFDFDFLQKRMIIGDTKGNITMHNTVNGAKMKTLTKHAGQVTFLISTQNDSNIDIFISCGIDNEIKVAKETEESFEIIRTIYLRKDIVICSLKYLTDTKLIVVGTNIGNMVFYDIQTGKNSGNVNIGKPLDQEITSINKTQQPLVITTTSSGLISIVGLPPLPTRFQKIAEFLHYDEEKERETLSDTETISNFHPFDQTISNYDANRSKGGLGIRCSCYSIQEKKLFVIDDKMYLTCYNFSEIIDRMEDTDYNKQKTQSQRRHMIYKVFDENTLEIVKSKEWTVKAHHQVIKSVEYIEGENLVITCSFDKKVKIWDSFTGDYIDSLQQNYSKKQPQPIGFLDMKNKMIYSSDKKKAIFNIVPDLKKMKFDPFYFSNLLRKQKDFTKDLSNKDWNVKINFKKLALNQIQTFQELNSKIYKIQYESGVNSGRLQQQSQARMRQIQKSIFQKRQIFKDINKENCLMETTKGTSKQIPFQFSKLEKPQTKNVKKLSTNYFKRSMMKCIKNFVDKNQNNELIQSLKEQAQSKSRKRQDFIPIYKMINNNEQTLQQAKQHKLYIEELSRQETQNMINSRRNQKIILDKQGADKARKLCKLLINTDRKDQRPKILMRSIEIRQRFGHDKVNSYNKGNRSQQKNLPRVQL